MFLDMFKGKKSPISIL